jgi:hypothetical protein
MTTLQIQLTLPDQLAQDAQRAGLLSPAVIEQFLLEKLKARKADELFSAMDRMAAIDEPAYMSPEEIASELASLRAEHRGKNIR